MHIYTLEVADVRLFLTNGIDPPPSQKSNLLVSSLSSVCVTSIQHHEEADRKKVI